MKKTPLIMFILSVLCGASAFAGVNGKYNYNAFARINIFTVGTHSGAAPTPSGIPFPETQVQFTELKSAVFNVQRSILRVIHFTTKILTGENFIPKHIF
ncbi:MAG: hypothetical protein ACEPO8_02420 [Rhodothermaceae bacterium]